MAQRDWLFVGCEGGHDMKHIGGRNAGCHADYCCCSVPVFTCARCGACDYGDNDEARQVVTDCLAKYGPPELRT